MGVDSLEKVLSAGGSVKVNAMSVESLCRLAAAARQGGATLTVVGRMSVDSMLRVVEAGAGRVTWDVAEYPIHK